MTEFERFLEMAKLAKAENKTLDDLIAILEKIIGAENEDKQCAD